MRPIVLTIGTALLLGSALPALAQAPLPWQNQPPAVQEPIRTSVPAITMYAIKSANIRDGAGPHAPVIGKVAAGQAIQVVPVVGGRWYQLTSGGFVGASLLSPQPVVVVARRRVVEAPRPAIPGWRLPAL